MSTINSQDAEKPIVNFFFDSVLSDIDFVSIIVHDKVKGYQQVIDMLNGMLGATDLMIARVDQNFVITDELEGWFSIIFEKLDSLDSGLNSELCSITPIDGHSEAIIAGKCGEAIQALRAFGRRTDKLRFLLLENEADSASDDYQVFDTTDELLAALAE